jgi:hypothetical protein
VTNELTTFDVTTVEIGDIIHYFHYEDGRHYIEQGEVKSGNLYTDGVEVYGEDWKQYVGKWFINKVVRNGEVIFEQEDVR